MNGTWAINTQAFSDCTSIQTVRLPKIMQNEEFSIGQYAFEGCTNLITIYRENQEIKVGTANLTGVTSFVIPRNDTEYIEKRAY